jgi:hypothetical protein
MERHRRAERAGPSNRALPATARPKTSAASLRESGRRDSNPSRPRSKPPPCIQEACTDAHSEAPMRTPVGVRVGVSYRRGVCLRWKVYTPTGVMDDSLQELAARAQKAGLSALFQVTKSVGTKQSFASSQDWRDAPKQLPEFLKLCVDTAGVATAEEFVLGPDLAAVATRNPMLLPDTDLEDLKKWFAFHGRAFSLRQYADEPHPQTHLEVETAELITEVARFVSSKLRAHGVKKPF